MMKKQGQSTFSAQKVSGVKHNFLLLKKIVDFLKERFLCGEENPLTLDQILVEIDEPVIPNQLKYWLKADALANNPRIATADGTCDKYLYKPPLQCRTKKALLRLLRTYDLKGLGGILRDDIEDSMPSASRLLKSLQSQLIVVTRSDKKEVIFFNDKTSEMEIDECFKEGYRAVNVSTMDIEKIEEHLKNAGLNMLTQGEKKRKNAAQKSKRKKSKISQPRDNAHVASILEQYDRNKM